MSDGTARLVLTLCGMAYVAILLFMAWCMLMEARAHRRIDREWQSRENAEPIATDRRRP